MADHRYYTLINKYLNLKELLFEYIQDVGNEPFSNEQNVEFSLLSCAIFMRFVEDLPNDKFYAYINKQISEKSRQIEKKQQLTKVDKLPPNDVLDVGAIFNRWDAKILERFVEEFCNKSTEEYYSNFNHFKRVEEIKFKFIISISDLLEKDKICDFSKDILEKRLNKYKSDLQKCVSPKINDLPFYILNFLYKLPTKSFIDRLFGRTKAVKLKHALKQILENSYENSIDCYLNLMLSINPPWRVFNEPVDRLPPPVPQLTYTEEELYKIIKSRIHVRKSLIQNRCFEKIIISDEAETEIAILSCAILMFYIPENQNDFYIEIENGMIPILMNMAYSNRLWNHVDTKFIEKRLAEYIEEIKQCLSEEETDLPYKSYYYLFNQPLAKKLIQQDFDDSEVAKFRDVLKKIAHEHSEVFNRVCIDIIHYKLITKPLLKREAFTSLSQY